MRGLVWIVALAACGKQSGMQISALDGGTKATTVRLFVGTGSPQMRDIHVMQRDFNGSAWTLDPNIDEDQATMSGGHADFFFESSTGTALMPIAIAVGFDASGAIVGAGELMNATVPGDGLLHYDIALTQPPGPTILTWDETNAAPAVANKCVAFNGHLIISADDQDCDGIITGSAKECEPDIYDAPPRTAAPDEFSCVRQPTTTSCVMGGQLCADGMGPMGACVPSGYCASLEMCNACLQAPDPYLCARLGGSSTSMTGVPHFDCLVQYDKDGNVCKGDLVLPQGSETDCTRYLLRNEQQNFFPVLAIDEGSLSLKLDTRHSSSCKVVFTPSGTIGAAAAGSVPTPFKSLLAVETAPDQGFVVPVFFNFAMSTMDGGDCVSGANQCTASANDPIVADSTLCGR